MLVALALALQADAAARPADPPARFSILVPVRSERCTRKPPPPAPGQPPRDDEIVVCADPLPSQAIPFPDQIVPDHAVPSNPDMKAAVALDGPDGRGECGRYGENCPIAGGGYLLPIVTGAVVGAVKDAFTRKPKPDKRPRIAIPLGDPTPGHAQP